MGKSGDLNRDLCANVHWSITHNSQKVEKPQMFTYAQNKIWYIHAIEYYTVIKRNEVGILATYRNT